MLLVESATLISSRRWHRQRLHLVLSAMAHFAAELRAEGFEVDHRRADTLQQGLRDHVEEFDVDTVVAMEPTSWDARRMLEGLGVELVPSDQFLCHYDLFAEWASGRTRLTMEDFYRWQRVRLGILVDDGPKGPAARRRPVELRPRQPRTLRPATVGRGRRSAGSNSTRSTAP